MIGAYITCVYEGWTGDLGMRHGFGKIYIFEKGDMSINRSGKEYLVSTSWNMCFQNVSDIS